MMAVKLLVKIAVMMLVPGGTPVPPEARGREPPYFFFPSGPWPPWRGRGESPSEIGSISLSLTVSAFWDSTLAPFLLYPEICNSDWIEAFARIFFQSFLAAKEGHQLPYEGPTRVGGAPTWSGRGPLSRATSGTVSR